MAKKKNSYNSYTNEVQEQMKAVTTFLVEKYGTIQAEWHIALKMLADNLQMFQRCGEEMKRDGLMLTNRFGVQEKHPLIKVQNDAQIQIVKLLNEFGLTPKALQKLKTEEADTSEEFINGLCS